MANYTGQLSEILLEAYQNASARLVCPAEAQPAPGQYIQATHPHDESQAVPVTLFAAGPANPLPGGRVSLAVLGALRPDWQPGAELALRGPLGRGFTLPKRAQRVALLGLQGSPGRLLPLAAQALAQGSQVALASQAMAVGHLPPAIEVHELNDLPRLLAWADYVALDLDRADLESLEARLGGRPPRAVTAQALVRAPMPCGGLAGCGVCSLPAGRGTRLACEQGPVFELSELFAPA